MARTLRKTIKPMLDRDFLARLGFQVIVAIVKTKLDTVIKSDRDKLRATRHSFFFCLPWSGSIESALEPWWDGAFNLQ